MSKKFGELYDMFSSCEMGLIFKARYLKRQLFTPPPPICLIISKLRYCMFIFISLILQNTVAQVGLGTNDPDPSSALQIDAEDKGILIPRVTLFSLTSAKITNDSRSPSAVESLLVYNETKNDAKNISKGFYYWDGSKWVKIPTSLSKPPSILEKTTDFQLDKSHHNALIKVAGEYTVTIPNDLPNGFKVTLIGNRLGRVNFKSAVPIANHSPFVQLVKNGKAELIFYKENGTSYVNLSGDLDHNEAFIIKVDIPNNNYDFKLGTDTPSKTYNYDVDWGDGKTPDKNVTGSKTHTYDRLGTYFIKILGTFPHLYFSDTGERTKFSNRLREIANWGDIEWESFEKSFYSADKMVVIAKDVPNLLNIKNMNSMFYGCKSITDIPNIGLWDIKGLQLKDLGGMFQNCNNIAKFPGIELWDASNVTNIKAMFENVTNFDQDISNWDVRVSRYDGCRRYIRGTKIRNEYMIPKLDTDSSACLLCKTYCNSTTAP